MHLTLICAVMLFSIAYGYPWFQTRIPNGNRVPNPCAKGSKIWAGVGHRNEPGGGARNEFGDVSFSFIL